MTDNTTNFLKRLKGITLSHNKRLMMRERLVAYADMHPALDPATSVSGGFFAFVGSRRFSLYAGALMALLVLGSGVTLAAEGSAPGDSLYAIKVNVNEPVMTAFAPTATDQAKVAATIATRRADEAVVLASRGTLTPERASYLETQFDKQLKIAAKKADELASSGNAVGAENVKDQLAANLASEAQALGASGNGSPEGRRQFLRILAQTDDQIAGDDTAAATAVTVASADDNEGTTTSHVFSATAKLSTSTTTPRLLRGLLQGRFARLHLNASTTLNANLSGQGIATPKLDTAIPDSGTQGSVDSSLTAPDGSAIEGGE